MKDSIRISYKRKITRFCVFLITILMASTLVCTVCADNIPVLKNVDIRLGDTIGLLFHTSIPYDSNIGTVKASVNNRDISPHVTRYNNDNCYTFLVTGIYPHEISQKITLSLSEPNVQFQTSVKEELKKTLNNSASADEKRFASDLLQYGEATWQYREHVNGTNLPCDITTNVDGYAPSGYTIPTSLINIGNSISAVHISSIGIAYSDTNHYVIEVEVPQAMQAGAKIDVVFKHRGQYIPTEPITHEGGTQTYSFESPALEAHKITKESLGVILNVNGTPVQTIDDYGLNNFIAQLSEVGATSDQGTALQYAKALYYYGESAAKVYNDKRVFAQYIDTSAMQNPRFINDEGKIVFKCDNAKMHVYHYDGTESDITDIAWTVQNTPTDYHNFYDIAVTGTAKIPSTDQTVVATTQKIRVGNTVTFTPSSTIFVATHDNGTLTLPAGKGDVIPAIGASFQVEWAENTLSTTLDAADAKTATGMKTLTLSHMFIDKNNEEVVVDIPFVYCNTIKSIEVLSTHEIQDEYKYPRPGNPLVNANWHKSDDGNFISFQPSKITVVFDNDASQMYDIKKEWEWNVNAKTNDSVKYADSISDAQQYEFIGVARLSDNVFKMVYGDPVTYGMPNGFESKKYDVSCQTQIMNRAVSINIHEATMIYTGTSSCDVKIEFSLTLESGTEVQLQENKTVTGEFDYVISGTVVMPDDTSAGVYWSMSRPTWELTMRGTGGVDSHISKSYQITPVDPIISVKPEQAKPTINILAKDSDTTKIPVTLSVQITRASGAQESADLQAEVENICNGDSKKTESVQFQHSTGYINAVVVIWNPINTFNATVTADAIAHENDTISIQNPAISITRHNGFKTTTSINITAPNIKDGTLSAARVIEYNEYSTSCPLEYTKPQITVIVNNPVVAITPISNLTAITLDSSKTSYDIPVYLLCKNGKRYAPNGTDETENATVTHENVISALKNATWTNNTAQCTITCSYDGKSTVATLSVKRTGGTIGSVEYTPKIVQLPSSDDGTVVTVKFTVYYDDGSSVDCTNTFKIYSSGTTTQGTPTTSTGGSARVELSYSGATDNLDISWENPVKSIEITTNPTVKFTGGKSKTTPTGGAIQVTYTNGATKTINSGNSGFTWSQVTYTGTKTQPEVTVKATYNGVSKSKSGVTADNPIESMDVVITEYTLEVDQTLVTLDKTVKLTLANGASKTDKAEGISDGEGTQPSPCATFWSAYGQLECKSSHGQVYRKLTYSYGTYDQEVVVTVNNPIIEPEFILSAVDASQDKLYEHGKELKIQDNIIIKRNNGAEIEVSTIAGIIDNVRNCHDSNDVDNGISNYTDNSEGELEYHIKNNFGCYDEYGSKILILSSIRVKVSNKVLSRTWRPTNIELKDRISKNASNYSTEFNKFQITLALTTYYTNGSDSASNDPALIGAGTEYYLCGGFTGQKYGDDGDHVLGWEPKAFYNYGADGNTQYLPTTYSKISYSSGQWLNVAKFLKNDGDAACWVKNVDAFVDMVYQANYNSSHRAYFFFAAPCDSIKFDGIDYYPDAIVQEEYKKRDGSCAMQCFTPFFDAREYLNYGYNANTLYIEQQ